VNTDGWYEATNNPVRMISMYIPAGNEPTLLREIAAMLESDDEITMISIVNAGHHDGPADEDKVEFTFVTDIGPH
jgi:hypothetical protein